MRFLLAILVPWFAFYTMGKTIPSVITLILQLTLIGWIPAAIWALYAVSNNSDEKIHKKISKQNNEPA